MPPDLHEQLQKSLGATYSLDRELGGGGMSRVFVAEEVALGRKVVVKVLPADLAEGVSAERFAREIQMAARLQQANIVPLIATGQADGLPYYTMPFVEGQSLRDRLEQQKTLSIPETISILRDVARALAYAHDKGVVHRDIKPENVLISGHAAVVTDFGIAKAISAARDSSEEGITQVGTSIGTPQYMAPEQAAGDPSTDHRADIYSFGCLAYELLCGKTPFGGLVIHQLFRAHMMEPPTPIQDLRPDVPPALANLVLKCFAKDPADRPQSAREILQSLEGGTTPVTNGVASAPVETFRTNAAVAVRSGVRRGAIVAALIGLGALGTLLAIRTRSSAGTGAPLLAVLPFTTAADDSASQYLADGTSDELAIALSKIPGVRVAARAASDHFRGKRDIDLRAVRSALGVEYVITGSVARAGPDVKVAIHLAKTSDGSDVWSQSFHRVSSDIFGVQDDLARATSEELGALLSTKVPTSTAAARESAHGTKDPDAYALYLEGQFLVRRRNVRQAKDAFEHAIARDSNFARAYSGLSEALAFFPQFTGTAATQVFDAATAAANRALALDSTLAQAHVSLGLVYMNAFMWEQAGLNFRRAVELDPGDASARLQYGRFLVHTGRLREARTEIDRAKQLDPFSGIIAAWSGYILYQSGKLADAVAECTRAIQFDSTNAVVLAISSFVSLGAKNDAVAVRYADKEADAPQFNGYTAYVNGAVGDRAKAEAIIHRLESRQPTPWFGEMAIAMGYLGLRDTTHALAALERSTDMRDAWTSYIPLCDPMYDPIRSSARFAQLLSRVGLDLRVFVPPPGGRCGGAS
ncbi:MAG TPA: protein kinase [Gemmatimonadaceae bacterium]|nr:protein kinase [Gemmatimonadaceae bacterium]